MNRTLPLAAVAACLLLGCGGGDNSPPYANVSGTVSFNGKPIEKGTITFATDGRPPSQMDIIDGKYAGQAMVGSNKISISAKRKAAGGKSQVPPQALAMAKAQMESYARKSGGGGQPVNVDFGTEEMIPPEWGMNSKQMRVVEAGGANKFDFEIKGK
jgi:hypothetical protein